MNQYIGVFYTMTQELCREICSAETPVEAQQKLFKLHPEYCSRTDVMLQIIASNGGFVSPDYRYG